MHWTLGNPSLNNALFWGLVVFGCLIAVTAFLLMGRPTAQVGLRFGRRPWIALGCALLFGGSFWMLASQMTAGRFFAMELNPDQVVLTLADGDRVVLARRQIAHFDCRRENKADYVLISTHEGAFYRGGPCHGDCSALARDVAAWLAADMPTR